MGGDPGHHPGESAPGPTPEKAGQRNGNGNSPLALTPKLGSSPPIGLQGGKSLSGEPVIANTDKNPHPKGPISGIAEPAPFDFGQYMADLQRRIRRAWLPPHQPDNRQVLVVFKIHRNGEMSNLRLSQSSGNAASDQAAMAAVERAVPFRPLPDACPEDEVDIQFTFDYRVFSGSGIYRHF
jgi:TonB family protein